MRVTSYVYGHRVVRAWLRLVRYRQAGGVDNTIVQQPVEERAYCVVLLKDRLGNQNQICLAFDAELPNEVDALNQGSLLRTLRVIF